MNNCFTQPVVTAIRGGNKRGGADLTATRSTGAGGVLAHGRKQPGRPPNLNWQILQKLLRH